MDARVEPAHDRACGCAKHPVQRTPLKNEHCRENATCRKPIGSSPIAGSRTPTPGPPTPNSPCRRSKGPAAASSRSACRRRSGKRGWSSASCWWSSTRWMPRSRATTRLSTRRRSGFWARGMWKGICAWWKGSSREAAFFPLPAKRGEGGERSEPGEGQAHPLQLSFKSLNDNPQYAVSVGEHVIVPEPEHAIASLRQHTITVAIALTIRMLTAVDFDDQTPVAADKIDDV